MYKKFFGLRENPFRVNPDPRYLFMTKQVREALASLLFGIQTRKGIVTLTGEVGTGKTTILNLLLGWLHRGTSKTAFLFNSRMNSKQVLDFVLAEFEIPCESNSKSQQLMKLNEWLMSRYVAGESAVLIIDEAQNLTFPVLEEIRMLTNLETATDKLLQIVLSGQPEFEEKLKLPQLRQLRQRIMIRCQTGPLTKDETQACILERLKIAGAAPNGPPIFSPAALEAVHFYSLGIPRVVNLLCEHGLISAFAAGERPIQAGIIEQVAREFQLDEVAPTASREGLRTSSEVYNLESFVQNLGQALSEFRTSRDSSSLGERS
jgi:general secretion pathway protein A